MHPVILGSLNRNRSLESLKADAIDHFSETLSFFGVLSVVTDYLVNCRQRSVIVETGGAFFCDPRVRAHVAPDNQGPAVLLPDEADVAHPGL